MVKVRSIKESVLACSPIIEKPVLPLARSCEPAPPQAAIPRYTDLMSFLTLQSADHSRRSGEPPARGKLLEAADAWTNPVRHLDRPKQVRRCPLHAWSAGALGPCR